MSRKSFFFFFFFCTQAKRLKINNKKIIRFCMYDLDAFTGKYDVTCIS